MAAAPEGPPALASRRLDLVPLGARDLDRLHAHWSAPEVGRWLWDGTPPTRGQVAAELDRSRSSFAARGVGLWGLYRRRGGGFVGVCGLLPVAEEGEAIEIIFSIEPGAWRRGYATEAARAVLRHGFEGAGLDAVVGRCDVPNEPSRRLLERLGMGFVKRAPVDGVDCLHYRVRHPGAAPGAPGPASG